MEESSPSKFTGYEETEKLFPFQVEKMRSKLQDNHKLVIPKECDAFLTRCLRLKDGNLEKAIKLILSFHAAIADFQNWDFILKPSLHRDFYSTFVSLPLRQRDSLGRRAFVFQLGLWDPKTTCFDALFGCIWMMAQYITADSVESQRHGYVVIWDCQNFSGRHALAVNHWRLISLGKWAQNGVMGRIKAFHVLNHARLVNLIYSGLKPFLKEKLKKRIKFHSSPDSMLEHFEKENLPTFLGGTVDYEDCVDMQLVHDLLNYDDYFKEMMASRLPSK